MHDLTKKCENEQDRTSKLPHLHNINVGCYAVSFFKQVQDTLRTTSRQEKMQEEGPRILVKDVSVPSTAANRQRTF